MGASGVVIGSHSFVYTLMTSHAPDLEMNANPISMRSGAAASVAAGREARASAVLPK